MSTAAVHPAVTPVARNATPFARRMVGLGVAVPATVVLAVAFFLQPAGAGIGTHERLGIPPCGWITMIDTPCPTCGMTTSFAHATKGRLLESFITQPMGFALAMTTAMVMMLGLYTAATGSHVGSVIVSRLWSRYTGWFLAGAVLAAWLFKILSHRGLL